jgi:hypothetical protein
MLLHPKADHWKEKRDKQLVHIGNDDQTSQQRHSGAVKVVRTLNTYPFNACGGANRSIEDGRHSVRIRSIRINERLTCVRENQHNTPSVFPYCNRREREREREREKERKREREKERKREREKERKREREKEKSCSGEAPQEDRG